MISRELQTRLDDERFAPCPPPSAEQTRVQLLNVLIGLLANLLEGTLDDEPER